MDTLRGIVLGNGPSRENYDFTGDVVIGCNIPGDGFSVDATVITDVEIIWVIANNPELITCPLIVSTKAYEKMKELRITDQFEVLDVFKPLDWHTSGHYATLYLTKIIGCNKIDIWGCDSYFTNDASSVTDMHVKDKGGLFFKQWRSTWDRIFADNPQVKYTVKRA